jgi:hypothetical protein
LILERKKVRSIIVLFEDFQSKVASKSQDMILGRPNKSSSEFSDTSVAQMEVLHATADSVSGFEDHDRFFCIDESLTC